jgi:hypothetical protein
MVQYRTPVDWDQWVDQLAESLPARNRWRLSLLIMGIVFATGRRTVTRWLRAVGISADFADYYYFLQSVGRRVQPIAERLLQLLLEHIVQDDRVLFAIDDSPTKRYGPHVQGAGIHHNPTPGPADQAYLYGHIWVTIALVLRHPLWDTIGLPLIGLLYVRAKDIAKIPAKFKWTFQTKLELAVKYFLPLVKIAQNAGKKVWAVADGAYQAVEKRGLARSGTPNPRRNNVSRRACPPFSTRCYAKRPFLKPLIATGVVVVSRLRKDAALYDLPPKQKRRGRGRPRKYGQRLSLKGKAAHRQGWQTVECLVYGKKVEKQIKTFLAMYPPAGGMIRVVIVKEDNGPQFFFCTDPNVTAVEIIEPFADRASIEQDFHDVKEVWGAGQQQVRVIWTNIACFNVNLWVQTLVECWAWHKPAEEIRDRQDSPWDDPDRRPSHADRRKALRRTALQNQYSTLAPTHRKSSKIRTLYDLLLRLAA